MGGLSGLEPCKRLELSNSPPELVSLRTGLQSARSSLTADRPRKHRNPASPPLPNNEKFTGGKDTSDDRSDLRNLASQREQLPSFQSLFGPLSAVWLFHSPCKRELTQLPQSPLQRARMSPSVENSRTIYPLLNENSQVSQPHRNCDSRLQSHSVFGSYPSSRSPKCFKRQTGRSEAKGSKRSTHQNTSRHEYPLGSRNVSIVSPEIRARIFLPGSKDPSRNHLVQQPPQANFGEAPTPDDSAPCKRMSAKDGHAPKMWMGMHDVPRFIRAANIPGEGMCYFYDDGSHCKAVIDGESVNAYWGVTKAGKPRRRLAIACKTCREKKIKCDPNYPRCAQCEKFGRICKFQYANGHVIKDASLSAGLDNMDKVMEAPLLPLVQNDSVKDRSFLQKRVIPKPELERSLCL